ncbi:MAG: sigma 54-interacting transcriptional regulator [Burkholderiales bacterium]
MPARKKSASPPLAPAEQLKDAELLVLREIGKLMGRSLDEGLVMREILHLLSEFLGLNRGRIVVPDGDTGEYCIKYAYGLTAQEIRRGRYKEGEGVTGHVIRSGETVVVQDIDSDPRFLARAVERATLPKETVSFIALPIRQEERIVGMLGVHRLRRGRRALADDLQLLRIVAAWIGQIMRLNQLVKERTARLEQENRELKYALEHSSVGYATFGIVGESPLLHRALQQLKQVAATDATVLLTGESGTGKELFARALHLASPRRDQPFVKVNCGAIPENLFESELFGHEKGAFTGASAARAGYFEQAQGGTIFLDEVGELPLAMQVKLLRVLQEGVVRRLGGRKEIPVSVRIVAATNQDLQNLVAQGRFRLDLFYRLNVIPIRLPSLRERREDVRALVRYHLNQINQLYQRSVSLAPEALERLAAYAWPGNIRQLRNVLERLVLLAGAQVVHAEEVEEVLAAEQSLLPAVAASLPSVGVRTYQPVQWHERQQIERALAETQGNKSRAAQLLGLTLRQLNYRIKVLGLD